MLAVLVKAFPDREADGMRKLVLIQASKNCTSKERDEKRVLVYYRRGRKEAPHRCCVFNNPAPAGFLFTGAHALFRKCEIKPQKRH
jgi:hypothetical protein